MNVDPPFTPIHCKTRGCNWAKLTCFSPLSEFLLLSGDEKIELLNEWKRSEEGRMEGFEVCYVVDEC